MIDKYTCYGEIFGSVVAYIFFVTGKNRSQESIDKITRQTHANISDAFLKFRGIDINDFPEIEVEQ